VPFPAPARGAPAPAKLRRIDYTDLSPEAAEIIIQGMAVIVDVISA
jgi:hypothetical protein